MREEVLEFVRLLALAALELSSNEAILINYSEGVCKTLIALLQWKRISLITVREEVLEFARLLVWLLALL